jgi:16S rRNA processing protein RimM
MTKNQCFELGYIERTLGFDGSVVACFDVDDSSRYAKVDGLFLEIGAQLVPYLITSIQAHGKDKFAIRFENIKDIEGAQKLKGIKIFLPEQLLPSLKKGQYYFHELVDCQVEDEVLGPLGTINGIVDLPHQTLATMDFQGQEVLIPVHDDIIKHLNREQKKVSTRLPEGLLEVYTKPEETNSL